MRIFVGIIIFILFYTPLVFAESGDAPANEEIEFSSNIAYYFLPDEDNLINPTISLLWNDLYIEARYNYESRDTGSVWLGYPIAFGQTIDIEFTPMVGGIFGEIDGVAPGFELDATWKQLNYYIEAEYIFDSESREGNFFYAWSEFTYSLVEHLRFGVAASRTRVYSSSVDVNRGPIAVFETQDISFSVAVLNLDSKAITMLSASLDF